MNGRIKVSDQALVNDILELNYAYDAITPFLLAYVLQKTCAPAELEKIKSLVSDASIGSLLATYKHHGALTKETQQRCKAMIDNTLNQLLDPIINATKDANQCVSKNVICEEQNEEVR